MASVGVASHLAGRYTIDLVSGCVPGELFGVDGWETILFTEHREIITEYTCQAV